MHVNEEIRATVKQVLQERQLTQSQLAEKIGVTPQALSRTLNDRGKVPGLWSDIFTELGLELTVKRVDNPLNFLIQMAESPDAAYFESDEKGRRVYDYGSTSVADSTRMVWYDPETWWVKLRRPLLRLSDIGDMEQIGDNGVAKTYRVLSGPLSGFRVAHSPHLLFIWSPYVPGMDDPKN